MQSNFKTSKQQAADPHETAIAVLGWLADDPEMFGRFLALTGVAPGQVRNAVNDPGFLAGLMDFLMNHEPTLLQFCQDNDVRVEWVQSCHQYFTGPGEGAWL